MSDNELDNLFKEAADGFKAPKDPSAWDAMSKRLDSAGVGTAGFWNWKTISTVSVVGITGIASILYFSNTDVKQADSIATAPNALKQSTEISSAKPVESASETAKKSESDKALRNSSVNESVQGPKSTESSLEQTSRHKAGTNSAKDEPISARTNADLNKVAKKSTDEEKSALANSNSINKENESQYKAGMLIQSNTPSKIKETANAKETTQVGEKASQEAVVAKENVSEKEQLKSTSIVVKVLADNKAMLANEEQLKSVKEKQPGVEQKQEVGGVEKVKREQELQTTEKAVVIEKQQEGLISEKADQPLAAQVKSQGSQDSEVAIVASDSVEVVKENLVSAKTEEIPAAESEDKPKGDKIKNRGLAVKVAIAPDYSAVGGETPSGLGYGYGLMFEYKLGGHWSVATGGIWEKKIYSAKDMEYNGHKADRVDGDCRMWDIPINVYYTFAPSRRLSFYTGLGFSSYIMNKENYVLYYDGAYGTYDYPVEVKGKNNEWFKMLNVSVGMQMRLNKVISLQVEPTLKAPLAGVGEGEVSLVSLGAFFNVRFDIPIKK